MSDTFFDMLKAIFFGGAKPNNEDEADAAESLLHVGWEQREQSFYPAMFGQTEIEPTLLTEEIFKADFGRNAVHPFWLHHSVISFPPTAERSTWLYATSGMSNAFDSQIEEWSGLGVEFILEVAEQAHWAQDKLSRLMVFNLLIAAGHYREQSDLTRGSIVRLGVPVTDEVECQLTNFIALQPTNHPKEFALVTGKVEFLQMIAITDDEADFAEKKGHELLAQKLKDAGYLPSINPNRSSVV